LQSPLETHPERSTRVESREFALDYLTTAPMDPPEALLLAQKVGYRAIGVRLTPLVSGGHFSPLGDNATLLRETVACSEDTGVAIFEIEGMRLEKQFQPGMFDRELSVAAEVGAKVVLVVGDDPEERRLIDSFANVCDAAMPYNLSVALEFIPYTSVPNSNSALRILEQARRPNARIVVDVLHARRSNTTCEDLAAIPRDWLSHAQLCDAPAEVPTTRAGLIHAARYNRLLPGTGGINVRAMVQSLPDTLPLSIEIPNTEQLALHGAEEWARRALSATRQMLASERGTL